MNNYSIMVVCPVTHREVMENVISVITAEYVIFDTHLSNDGGATHTHAGYHLRGTPSEYAAIYNLFHAGVDYVTPELLELNDGHINAAVKDSFASFKNSHNWKGRPIEHFNEALTILGLVRYVSPEDLQA